MLSLKTPVVAALSLLAAIGTSASFAADGDLDPSFGTGGIAYITPDLVDAQELQPYTAIVLPDGKILFGGSLDVPTTVPFEQEYRGMLARFNADGTVDAGFGNGSIPGIVALPSARTRITAWRASSRCAPRRRLDHRGRHLAGELGRGRASSSSWTRTASSIRRSPAAPATCSIPLDYAHAVGIDSQGRIVVAGETIETGRLHGERLRFNADGTPDATFGDDGIGLDRLGRRRQLGLSRRSPDRLTTTASSSPAATRSTAAASAPTSRSRKLDSTGAPDRDVRRRRLARVPRSGRRLVDQCDPAHRRDAGRRHRIGRLLLRDRHRRDPLIVGHLGCGWLDRRSVRRCGDAGLLPSRDPADRASRLPERHRRAARRQAASSRRPTRRSRTKRSSSRCARPPTGQLDPDVRGRRRVRSRPRTRWRFQRGLCDGACSPTAASSSRAARTG